MRNQNKTMNAQTGSNDLLDFISSSVDSFNDSLRLINLKIHDNPELCYEEYIAHDNLVSFLKTQSGWKVTPSAYDIATAFVAEFDSGKHGAVVSFNAEYDALPGIGHACGHNLIATSSLAAALAVAAAIEKFGLQGRVVLFGTPAEEGGGGKIKLLDAGAYRDHKVDVSLMAHPNHLDDAALVTTSACTDLKVEYFGKTAHGAANPWQGINALDALITAYNALSVLRQQTMPSDIIGIHITNGGEATNIIHEYSSADFLIRSTTKARLEVLLKKVHACLNGAAEATGASVKITTDSSYADHTPNHALARGYRFFFNELGGNIAAPDVDIVTGRTPASTDQGNVSHAYPSLHSSFRILSEAGPHNPGFTKSAGTEDAHLMALRTGKALAATAVEVLSMKEYLREIKEEFGKLDN